MNRYYLDRQLKKRKELKHYEVKPVGSALRLRRKELNMTLEEGAEGICSVSYLSKLENNQIEPNLNFVDKLYEKFGMKDQVNYEDYHYESDFTELSLKMLLQESLTRNYSEHYEGREDHQARVIQVIEETLKGNYDQMHDSFKIVIQFIPHLKHSELSMIILCACEGLMSKQLYQEAYEMVCEIPLDVEKDEIQYVLTLRMRLLLSFSMHKTSDIHLLYDTYLERVNHEGYYHLAKEIRLKHLLHLAHYNLPSDIENLSKSVDRNQELELMPYAISCFTHRCFHEVIRLARLRKDLSKWLVIYLISLEECHLYDELKEVLSKRIPSTLSNHEKVFVHHFQVKYEIETKSLLPYLRKEVLGNRIQCDDPHILEYIMLDSSRLFQKSQFYKEANLVISQYQPILKKLRLAYQRNKG